MQGKIVSISGFDGVGKTTQINCIINNLKRVGYAVSLFDVIEEDTYSNYKDLVSIKNILSHYKFVSSRLFLSSPLTKKMQVEVINGGEDIFKKTQLIEQLCEYEKKDSIIWFQEVILPLREKGVNFFFDRYFYDLIAYSSLYGVNMSYLENLFLDFVQPDIKWYLKRNLDSIININKERLDGKTILYKNKNKLIELEKNWECISKKYQLDYINGDQVILKISNELMRRIYDLL